MEGQASQLGGGQLLSGQIQWAIIQRAVFRWSWSGGLGNLCIFFVSFVLRLRGGDLCLLHAGRAWAGRWRRRQTSVGLGQTPGAMNGHHDGVFKCGEDGIRGVAITIILFVGHSDGIRVITVRGQADRAAGWW